MVVVAWDGVFGILLIFFMAWLAEVVADGGKMVGYVRYVGYVGGGSGTESIPWSGRITNRVAYNWQLATLGYWLLGHWGSKS